MIVALHSVLKDGAEAEYTREHQRIPDDLAASFERIGIHDWTIWRSGRDLFHLVDCDDYVAAMQALVGDPADEAWQARIGVYVDHFVGEEDGPSGQMLPRVWRLREQTGRTE